MPAEDALLFIDTTNYLELYGMNDGRKLLAPLQAQAKHIFCTQQVVNEVHRRKLGIAQAHFANKVGRLRESTFDVPIHLYGTKDATRKELLKLRDIAVEAVEKANQALAAWTAAIMEDILHGRDEVSKALAAIFDHAAKPTEAEIERAAQRKRLGNPPGKAAQTVGDELSWEQLLSHFRGKKRLWVISRDGDYGTKHGDKILLNAFLLKELCAVAKSPEAFVFDDTIEGLEHFEKSTGVEIKDLPKGEEAEQFKKEAEALPPSAYFDLYSSLSPLASGSVPTASGTPGYFGTPTAISTPGYIVARVPPQPAWSPKPQVLGGVFNPRWTGAVVIAKDAGGQDWAFPSKEGIPADHKITHYLRVSGPSPAVPAFGAKQVGNGDTWLAGLRARGFIIEYLDQRFF